MNYTTYISAAEKLKSLGQKAIAESLIDHANRIEERKISDLKFDILVGEVKAFKDAKFSEVRVLREKEGNTLMFIFNSGSNNTHRINVTVNTSGSLKWNSGNLFLDRKSVKSFFKLVKHIVNYKKDVIKLLSDMSIKSGNINLIERTFYI